MDKNIPQYTIPDEDDWNTCPNCQNIYDLIKFGQEKCESCGQLFKWED